MHRLLFIAVAFCSTLNFSFSQNSETVDNLLHVLSFSKDSKSKIEVLLCLSTEIEGYDQKQAMNYAQQAYQLARQTQDNNGEINALIQKGNCYFRMSEYKRAMECAESSQARAEKLGMEKEIALSLNIIGRIYYQLGDNENSSEQFFKSLRIFEKIHDNKGISQSLGFIGSVYFTQKDYNKALGYLNKSLSMATVLKDRSLITKQLNNIAVVYLNLKKYDTVIRYINEAIKMNKKDNDKLSIGINYINIGYAQFEQKKYDEALNSFLKALELEKEINNHFQIADCYLSIGQCYSETGKKSTSIDAFKSALREAQQNCYNNIIFNAAENLENLYLEKKDTCNAYKYSIIKDQGKDSLSHLQTEKTLSNIEFQYQTKKKEFAKELAQQKIKTMMMIIIIGLISGLIITILVLSKNRIKAKNAILEKQTMEKELSFKNKELSINLIAIMKKNEMMYDISSRLIQIEKKAVKEETKEAIKIISKELRKSADNKMWKEFSARFQEVHSGFYEALLEKFPTLTQNELKLCAFLRLNMTTKEISELTGQRKLTLENARYRLRKKLGITNSESNLVTFLSQI